MIGDASTAPYGARVKLGAAHQDELAEYEGRVGTLVSAAHSPCVADWVVVVLDNIEPPEPAPEPFMFHGELVTPPVPEPPPPILVNWHLADLEAL